MNIDLIIKLIISILGTILTYLYIKNDKFRKIVDSIDKAVRAVEQMEKAGNLDMPKKEKVIEYAINKGINLPYEELEVIIEALVYKLNMEKKKIGDAQ